MKKAYESPKIEEIKVSDVITASNITADVGGGSAIDIGFDEFFG